MQFHPDLLEYFQGRMRDRYGLDQSEPTTSKTSSKPGSNQVVSDSAQTTTSKLPQSQVISQSPQLGQVKGQAENPGRGIAEHPRMTPERQLSSASQMHGNKASVQFRDHRPPQSPRRGQSPQRNIREGHRSLDGEVAPLGSWLLFVPGKSSQHTSGTSSHGSGNLSLESRTRSHDQVTSVGAVPCDRPSLSQRPRTPPQSPTRSSNLSKSAAGMSPILGMPYIQGKSSKSTTNPDPTGSDSSLSPSTNPEIPLGHSKPPSGADSKIVRRRVSQSPVRQSSIEQVQDIIDGAAKPQGQYYASGHNASQEYTPNFDREKTHQSQGCQPQLDQSSPVISGSANGVLLDPGLQYAPVKLM